MANDERPKRRDGKRPPQKIQSTPFAGGKRIHVYRNGDTYYKGIDVAVNVRYVTINQLLDELSEKIGLLKGVKALYTLDGNLITSTDQLENRQEYVASSGGFLLLPYGKHNSALDASRRSNRVNNRSHSRPSKTPSNDLEMEKNERKNRKSMSAVNPSEIEPAKTRENMETPDKSEANEETYLEEKKSESPAIDVNDDEAADLADEADDYEASDREEEHEEKSGEDEDKADKEDDEQTNQEKPNEQPKENEGEVDDNAERDLEEDEQEHQRGEKSDEEKQE